MHIELLVESYGEHRFYVSVYKNKYIFVMLTSLTIQMDWVEEIYQTPIYH